MTIENILLALTVLSGVIFILSMLKDSRRFRNAVYLLLFLLLLATYILVYFGPTKYGSLVAVIFALLVIFTVLIVPLLLIFNGFVMMRREGTSLANLLSLLFGIFILVGEFFVIRGFYHLDMIEQRQFPLQAFYLMTGFAVFYVSMIFLSFLFYTWIIKLIPRRANYNYVIVLGAGLINGERVSKLLSDRLDKGIKVYEKSKPDCKIICSGGKGSDEKISEARAMKNYLIDKGIDRNDILMEDRSTDTMENLAFSKKLIEEREGDHYTAVVTSGYHVLRAMIYCRRVGLQADGIGAHTAFYYWPSAMIREYVALVRYYIFPYLLGLLVQEFILFVYLRAVIS